jgi:UDP-N-acetylglucosamine--N-acetylmuramyl-(pentapeptide) pyrophosphoryl-undecaprenol N-acetylglucosamine transferase
VNIAFTGGGTGGHIYPGLAVAFELKRQLSGLNYRIFWIGSSTGMDRSIVEEAGVEFYGVPSGKLRRYFSLKTVLDFFKVAASFFATRKILKKQKPCLIFSKGGFVSVPPCAAAASLGIPVFSHESDFSPGLATKINVRFVPPSGVRTGGKIFTAYEETKFFFQKKIHPFIIFSGNPVRASFRNPDPCKARSFLKVKDDTRILFVLGGSQGAREINELIQASLDRLTETYTVVHQIGMNTEWNIEQSEKYKPFSYIRDEMPGVMAASELIIGRSGAGIWEWAVCGKPMILIPLRGSGTRGDQVENARYFEKAGAAVVLTGSDVNPDNLLHAVNTLAQDDDKRRTMSLNSGKIGECNSAGIIAHVLMQKIKQHEGKNEN